MTAEVLIINNSAVALAADSAVTISGLGAPKVYTSANKLFRLSAHQPVGIMFYGVASLLDVPWEMIIKMHREWLDDRAYDTLYEYGESLIAFIEKRLVLSEKAQHNWIRGYLARTADAISTATTSQAMDNLVDGETMSADNLKQILVQKAQAFVEMWQAQPEHEHGLGKLQQMRETLMPVTNKLATEVAESEFTDEWRSQELVDSLTEIASLMIERRSPEGSGIVVAGYGTKDMAPCYVQYDMSGFFGSDLLYTEVRRKACVERCDTDIVPLAQVDVVTGFIEGIEPGVRQMMHDTIREMVVRDFGAIFREGVVAWSEKQPGVAQQAGEKVKANATASTDKQESTWHWSDDAYPYDSDDDGEAPQEAKRDALRKVVADLPGIDDVDERLQELGEQFVEELVERMATKRLLEVVGPLLTAFGLMPKKEMAEAAAAFVSLTSLKRRIELGIETVGGPVDAAVISKSDGFVWIQRKRYYDPELNPHLCED